MPTSSNSNSKLSEKFSKKQRQWLWFIGLYLAGLSAISLIAYIIRLAMGIE